jgi:hypothetical protein
MSPAASIMRRPPNSFTRSSRKHFTRVSSCTHVGRSPHRSRFVRSSRGIGDTPFRCRSGARSGVEDARGYRQGAPLSGTHDGRCDNQLTLVHKRGAKRVHSEFRTSHKDITLGTLLQLPNCRRIKSAFKPGPSRGYLAQCFRIDDLVGKLPDLREVPQYRRLLGEPGVSLPGRHGLIHSASVQKCTAERTKSLTKRWTSSSGAAQSNLPFSSAM